MTAWVFLPGRWHAICAPVYLLTISVVVKSITISSMILVNRDREAAGELWQERFFTRASYEYLCGEAAPCPGYSKGVQQAG
jgi:hypothetical protein